MPESGQDVFDGTTFSTGYWSAGGFDNVGSYRGGTLGSGTATLTGTVTNANDLVQVSISGSLTTLRAYAEVTDGIILQSEDYSTFYLFMSNLVDVNTSYPTNYDFGGFNPPCFVEGTCVRTRRGPIAVECLRVGEGVWTLGQSRYQPVRWLGHRTLKCGEFALAATQWPVRIRKDAFAKNKPCRDLYISPDHSIYVGKVLIPIKYLINGSTISQVHPLGVTYWHVELDHHDILVAENLAVESYLDNGNRRSFANGRDRSAFAPRHLPFAPIRHDPESHAPVKRALRRRVSMLGVLTDDPALSIIVSGRPVPLERDGFRWQARLPGGVVTIQIATRTSVPADVMPSHDGRHLGVAITSMTLDGQEIPTEAYCRISGWYPPEDGLQWTTGDATVQFPKRVAEGALLKLTAAPLLRYSWLPA